MNVVVTGASGRIGRYVVRDLSEAGHQVTGIDIVPGTVPGVPSLLVDLTDPGQVYRALARASAEAVVHMGAWASDELVPDGRTYGDNVCGTFNLFQACADLGIRRIVSASSNHVYGFVARSPLYVPVDEGHPLRPASAYGLSKVAGERAAAYFGDRWGLEILSFRLLGIRTPAELDREVDLVAQDPGQRLHLMWTRCDARDAARACRLAVEADQVEPGPYHITGPRIVLDEESAELVRRYLGPSTEIRPGLVGSGSPFSCALAEAKLGYRPQYGWSVHQRHPEEDE